ncbi:MAG: LutB/LldF family L-lactate oxidation iron-sulfur protein [Rhodocyclaceae bacterium]|nr:LutB/LldF family L-lactate oxidation iron-sulfur protein [Rhodocyclaceae bacterium]
MESRAHRFRRNIAEALANPVLQANLSKAKGKFVEKRAQAIQELDDFEATREAAREIRDRVLANLDLWLETFEANARARGATVLWAKDGNEVSRLVVEIAKRHGVKKVVKSKSMLSEEAGLNQALLAAGIEPVETDLGEYILQINGYEPPSHIIAPVVHKSLDEIADLFARTHRTPRKTEIAALTREARQVLREHFLTAEMGVTGGNFLIAETGSVALVTNEGNGRMVTTLPRVHVAITGIEKIVPTLEDLSTLMRLLPRSATGQSISNYVSVLTGTKNPAELDGPEHLYFILVDNGRTRLLGSDYQPMLRCIRCGACMNHCPVYQTIGGQAYGWVYPGPMGSVLTPLLLGLEKAHDLPYAATLCNQCGVVCPVKIPLPELLRNLREEADKRRLRPWRERLALRAWAWIALRPSLYALASRLLVRYLAWLAEGRGGISVLAAAPGWTMGRNFPAPEGETFRTRYRMRKRGP